MQFTLHKNLAEIPAPAWNALAAAGISDTPFARHEYLSQWWQTRGGGEWNDAELVLVSASEHGPPIGIAPLFRTEHNGRQALLLLGSIEISDYLDLIVVGADLPEFISGLLDFLAHTDGLSGLPLDWYNIPDSSPTLAVLRAECEKRGWAYREEDYRPTPRISLPGDYEAYLASLDKKQRHEIRRKIRRASEGGVPVGFHIVEDGSTLDSEMESLIELMSANSNKAGFLRPAMREQMRGVMRNAFANGYLWLAFLTISGVKAAAVLNFDYGNKLWGYNSGVSHEFLELSPGWLLLAHQIEWACQHGRSEFDFMRGDEDYKYRFGAVNKYVMRAVAAPR